MRLRLIEPQTRLAWCDAAPLRNQRSPVRARLAPSRTAPLIAHCDSEPTPGIWRARHARWGPRRLHAQKSRRSRLPTPSTTPRSNPKTPAKRPPIARPRPRRTPISPPLCAEVSVPEPSDATLASLGQGAQRSRSVSHRDPRFDLLYSSPRPAWATACPAIVLLIAPSDSEATLGDALARRPKRTRPESGFRARFRDLWISSSGAPTPRCAST